MLNANIYWLQIKDGHYTDAVVSVVTEFARA